MTATEGRRVFLIELKPVTQRGAASFHAKARIREGTGTPILFFAVPCLRVETPERFRLPVTVLLAFLASLVMSYCLSRDPRVLGSGVPLLGPPDELRDSFARARNGQEN